MWLAETATASQPKGAKLACFVEQKLSHTRTPSQIHPLRYYMGVFMFVFSVCVYECIFSLTNTFKHSFIPLLSTANKLTARQ